MKKVGIILANPGTNYGAHLQAYATQYAIDSLGVDTEIIDYRGISDKGHYYIDLGLLVDYYKSFFRKFAKKKVTSFDEEFKNNKSARVKLAKDFRSRRLHGIIKFSSYKELVNHSKSYYAVIIGSDQMWTPGISFTPFHSLRFAPKGTKRVSYATSLGVSEYPRHCWNSARDMWTKMDNISVREEQGADIIRKVCNGNVNVQVVVDPTYLLTKEQWEDVIPTKQMSDKKYVFCYFLGDDKEAKMCARRFADKNHLHLVSILSCESYSDIDRTFADETIGAISPEDFINWIRGAEYVFTDSFHGLAFSVINHKQFFVFYRKRRDAAQSRNSRIDNILNLWECSDRIITDPALAWGTKVITPIDYKRVESIVSSERNKSFSYLKKALDIHENE